MFESLRAVPADPILNLSVLYRQDTNPNKVDLGVGVYKDETGHTAIMEAVARAEERLLAEEDTKAYVGMAGSKRFCELLAQVTLGADHAVLADQRIAVAQTPGGSGALRVLGEFINVASPNATVWLGNPTWANHHAVMQSAGFTVKEYPYYNRGTRAVDFDAMLNALQNQTQAGDVVLLHGCCHNPSGADLSLDQWQAITDLVLAKGLIPYVDIAYQGLGEGMDEDAAGLRLMANAVPEMVIASSCSKNFGLYRERTGTAMIIAANAQQASLAQGQMNSVIRANYSMPPSHGALVVETILADPKLKQMWRDELKTMRKRIKDLRSQLVDAIKAEGVTQDFSFIERQKGMFSFLGVSAEQVDTLVNEHSVYLVGSSRINLAGLNQRNIAYVAKSIAAVL
ncbi:MAG: aspartate/tyrosine/aromatic aminotransferase [Oceanospirillaceae bacterium]|jgi:aspartate aminotransferase|nr:aspartate/tyrosine/aromatic aminotransferase [Oceanospirillaceae bacterium]MBT4443430.1 aspartate/tyrosine/aromatic aminotransferase [Oceanospirillaceae bacterium]MBT6077713.1 aspartate/tyrosine/aromatic aminotransferase [Oceanospirillaceae bacterium]MBT7330382.1 aspartate/tyrosine/aromatic aminotransferase [Oceanospirillaceae bacterium]